MARILNLDDDPQILDLYRLILTERGHQVISTTSCYEAIDILRREPVDLFTEDLLHPGMDGWQVLQTLSSDPRLGRIPVLIVSAVISLYSNRCRRVGRNYLAKPFGLREFVAAVDQQLERHGESQVGTGEV
jgi:DNA-binding response OmpR family regulator